MTGAIRPRVGVHVVRSIAREPVRGIIDAEVRDTTIPIREYRLPVPIDRSTVQVPDPERHRSEHERRQD